LPIFSAAKLAKILNILASKHWCVTRVNDSARVMIFGDSDSTWVTLSKIATRLESRFSQNDSIESQSMTESFLLNFWAYGRQTQLVCTQWSFFASVMFKIGAKCLFWLSSCAVLPFKNEVFHLEQNYAWDFAFHCWANWAQYTDILSKFNAVFAYREDGSRPHTVTVSLFQMAVYWFRIFKFKSIQKLHGKIECKCENEILFKSNFLSLLLT